MQAHELAEFFDSLPVLVLTARSEARCTYLSPGWSGYTGIAAPEHLGSGWLEAVHPHDRARVAAASGDAARLRSSLELECRLERRDGRFGRFRMRGGPARTEAETDARRRSGSSLWCAVFIELDAHDEPLAEGELAEAARLSAVLAQAGEWALLGAWWVDVTDPADVHNNPLHWSDEVYRIFGYEPRQVPVTMDLFFERVHPDDRARVTPALERAIAERNDYGLEHRIVRPDGVERIVLEHARFTFDEEGRPRRIVGAVQDVTERRRAEASLRSTAERLALAQEAGRVGVFDWDLETRKARWTPELAKILDLPLVETPTDHYDLWAQRVHPDDLAAIRSLFDGWLPSDRDEESWEYRITCGGQERWITACARLLRNPNGEPRRMIGTNVDITDRKRAEEALREADRRKDEFLAMLSHELRNPLAPIRNSIAILERAAPGGEQARRAQTVIDRQVAHMARIVDDLLDVTRISRGKIHLQRERTDLGALASRTAEDHRSVFANGGVELDVQTIGEPMFAEVDPTRLAQVIGNVLQNAARFTPPGGKTTLSLEREGPSTALIRVRDTGAGIGRNVLPHLFEPFMQASQSLDRQGGGLGLGLALVKGLVELHRGTVTAKSDGPGLGTEILVRLPVLAPANETAAREAATHAPKAPHTPRVLVIEDNVDAADSLKEALELYEHVVEVAYDGAQGIEKARVFHPDVVLCDIGLPAMDGYEVARRMRADPELHRIHLIALSGYGLPEDLRRSENAGFEDHLVKPPSLETLEARLVRVMR